MSIKVITIYTLLFLLLLVQAGIGQRPKIGLALSGGGARGFAHIGTLKLLDELQIPVDYIAGTSIGAIVGGLYASGYTAREIEEIAHEENWSEFFTDRPPRTTLPYLHKKDDGKYHLEFGLKGITPIIPGGLIGGQKISLMLSNLTASTNVYSSFDDLPIPFRCVAVDLLSGRDVVLGKGPLAKALRSSMSIPTVFSPVEWGDSLLIDGGVLNNFPADVVKDMGADIIIGVNVGQPLKGKEDLESLISILDQTMILTDYERQQANSALCDILVLPELSGFPPIDFDTENIRQIMSRGDDAAEGVREELQHLKNRFIDDILVYAQSDSVLLINPVIQNFAVSGNVSFPPEYFRDYLGCKPGNRLDRELVEMNLDRLRASGRYDEIAYEVVPVHENNVRIILTINERRQPVIFGVSITGQRKLPYMFIYNLLGIKPSQMFDKDLLNERINEMYSLGYFETIEYTIVPVTENAIRLVFHIREKPLRKLRLGFRYDDEYKTVGIIGIQATNLPLPGFMIESSVEFSGLLRFEYTLAYPSRRLNLPVFPFIRLRYKDIPYNLYDQISGNKIAQYDDRGYTAGGGLGVLFADTGILELEFHQEEVDINPELASLDPEFFPSWKDRLRKLRILMRIDLLDDPVIPRRGDLWNLVSDLSLRDLNSDLDYQQIELQWDTYKTPFRKHTFHLQAYGTTYWNDLPGYKFPFKGGPHNVVGLKYNQIEGNKFGYLRFDYRFQYRRDVFFKVIYNTGLYKGDPDYGFDGPKLFYGYGLGLKFLSIIGPFELIASRGSQSMQHNTRMHTNIYFSQGLVF